MPITEIEVYSLLLLSLIPFFLAIKLGIELAK